MSENHPQWQPTNPPTPPVQQGWFARNKVLSMLLGVALVVLLCCCGAGVLAVSGDMDDSTSSTSEESTEDTTSEASEDESSDAADETSDTAQESSPSSSEPQEKEDAAKTPQETSEDAGGTSDNFSQEEENAISAAESYLDFMPFSRKGLIQQLSSDAGDGYPKDVAETAVAHIESDVDWNEQAVKSAENYQDLMPMSRAEMIQQLSSDAGEGFTQEQAEHAADELGL